MWRVLSDPKSVVFICGDARAMAPDVKRSFQRVIENCGGRSNSMAANLLASMVEADQTGNIQERQKYHRVQSQGFIEKPNCLFWVRGTCNFTILHRVGTDVQDLSKAVHSIDAYNLVTSLLWAFRDISGISKLDKRGKPELSN